MEEEDKLKTSVEEQGMDKGKALVASDTATVDDREKIQLVKSNLVSGGSRRDASHVSEACQSSTAALDGIMEALTHGENINTVGVCGSDSTETADLIKKVSRRAKGDKLFDVVVMATVSHKPNISKIQDEIAETLGLKFDGEKNVTERARRLREKLQMEHKVLVILRDLCNKGLDLFKVGIPSSGPDSSGCKLLLTSASEAVLLEHMPVEQIFKMADGDRNHVAIQIEVMLASAEPLFTSKCCIYRVPHQIRLLNQVAYTPNVVSVGPLHHGDTKLLPMEGHKQVYCKNFIGRCRSKKVSLDDLVSCVQESEPEVRQSYSDKIKLNKEELVKMILVDCGFIIELFLTCCSVKSTQDDDESKQDDDVILLKPWLEKGIRLDLLLLENQLPFFILEKLYNLAVGGGHRLSFLALTCSYFNGNIGKNLPSAGRVAHFTDLLRTSHLQPNEPPSRDKEILDHLYSASELNEAGVKFTVNDESDKSLLDLQFVGRYFKIPKIEVKDSTETLIRNMVALEQCHYPNKSFITDYVHFMDFLINTDKDVDVLVKNEIIMNWLSHSNEVATMFNGLCKNILHVDFNTNYLHIANKLNAYYKHPLHSKMATLKRDYCNTTWKMVASIAGIALLILTIIQTVFSIIQVV